MNRRMFKLVMSSVMSITLLFSAAAFAADKKIKHSDEIQGFIDDFVDEMVEKHKFDAEYLDKLFSKIKINKIVTQKMDTPYEAKPWHKYQSYFLTEKRIDGGVKYWKKHQKALEEAEEKYGVPANIIIAIIGVETTYGETKGSFPVFETLTTLAFNYPKRAKFFKKELEEFLLLTREEGFDPLSIKGSYAGAMGLPQFMPSSYRYYAVKFAGNKSSDLIHNDKDAIGSVANYLKKSGWAKDQLIAVKAKVKGENFKKLVKNKRFKPTDSVQTMKKNGVKPESTLASDTQVALIEFDIKDGKEYWLGLKNFYAISRYNNHKHYCLAVYQLSEKIKDKFKNA